MWAHLIHKLLVMITDKCLLLLLTALHRDINVGLRKGRLLVTKVAKHMSLTWILNGPSQTYDLHRRWSQVYDSSKTEKRTSFTRLPYHPSRANSAQLYIADSFGTQWWACVKWLSVSFRHYLGAGAFQSIRNPSHVPNRFVVRSGTDKAEIMCSGHDDMEPGHCIYSGPVTGNSAGLLPITGQAVFSACHDHEGFVS